MLNLDPATLLIVAFYTCVITGALTLMAAFYCPRDKTLAFAGIGWLAEGCTGVIVTNASSFSHGELLTIWVSNFSILLAYGFIWAALRSFTGKTLQWWWIPAGSVVWIGLCLWPPFVDSLNLRIVAFSLIMLSYMAASMRIMWPVWRKDKIGATPVMALLALHSLFYIYRMVPRPAAGHIWQTRTDMGVTILENCVFILGLSYSLVLMVRARSERQLQYASHHDDLTGLCNRRALFDCGGKMHAQATCAQQPLAALMFDLDWFKSINDQYGHNMGDRVLILFAGILVRLTPEHGVCARLGGEEFVMLTPDTSADKVQWLARAVHVALAKAIAGLPPKCSVSIGTAISGDTSGIDRLLSRADQALYAAKTSGRNCTRAWNETLGGTQTTNVRVARQ